MKAMALAAVPGRNRSRRRATLPSLHPGTPRDSGVSSVPAATAGTDQFVWYRRLMESSVKDLTGTREGPAASAAGPGVAYDTSALVILLNAAPSSGWPPNR